MKKFYNKVKDKLKINNWHLNLDICRIIAALMIVAIHIYPLESFNATADYMLTRVLFRIAVPLFLMITGYYILPKAIDNISKLKDYTKKIIKLYLISILIYLPINIYNGYFNNLSITKLIKDILINGTFLHLWYFPALILGIWFCYIMLKKLDKKVVGTILSILFIIGLFGDNYYGLISDIPIIKSFYNLVFLVSDYTRNGIFYVPIFLYLGYMVKTLDVKLNKKLNIWGITLWTCLMLIEGGVLYYFKVPRHSSMYLSLIPLAYLLFYYLINNGVGSNKKLRDIATWIYIMHPFIIVVVHFISKISFLKILNNNSLVNYVVVCILTYLVVAVILKLKNIVLEKLKKQKEIKG